MRPDSSIEGQRTVGARFDATDGVNASGNEPDEREGGE